MTRNIALLRWLNVTFRGLHLVAVILLGASLLGAPVSGGEAALGVAFSGFTMFILDIWRKPSYLRETAGLSVLVKLLMVGWMAMDAASRPILFWLIVVASAIFAHAPGRFRHAVLIGPQPDRAPE